METLERYLDQACHGIGGPRELRRHIRQELREHLLDAVAAHRAAGMSEEEALVHALDDFGGPEQVRMELEAMHGHRLMTLVVDKAMEWKEKTMRSKWLWTTWAHAALAGVIAVEVAFLCLVGMKIIPAHLQYWDEGWLNFDPAADPFVSWAHSVLMGLFRWFENLFHFGWLVLIVLIAVWVLFEWRVRSENKSLIRLAALGTGALGLIIPVALASALLMIVFAVGLPAMYRHHPEHDVQQGMLSVESSLDALDQALAKKDWDAIRERSRQLGSAIYELAISGAAAPVLLSLNEQPKIDQLRMQLTSGREQTFELSAAIEAKDSARLEAATKRIRDTFTNVCNATKKLEP